MTNHFKELASRLEAVSTLIRTGCIWKVTENCLEELRLPLLLHYMEGYKLAEIAGALGQSLPQVTSRLFRARKRLKRMLEEAEV